MNFTALFIKRPVMTTLVMVGILGFGGLAYTRLAVSDLPSVDYPTITVNASIPGASPETMASSVATPLEKAFTTIAGIDNMVSTSLLGATSITYVASCNTTDSYHNAMNTSHASKSGWPASPSASLYPPPTRRRFHSDTDRPC